jgi:hypothetical protein
MIFGAKFGVSLFFAQRLPFRGCVPTQVGQQSSMQSLRQRYGQGQASRCCGQMVQLELGCWVQFEKICQVFPSFQDFPTVRVFPDPHDFPEIFEILEGIPNFWRQELWKKKRVIQAQEIGDSLANAYGD